ncbi:hypothetical protein BDQ12DRAFT_718721 [Crucibulum laeve]|uniref:Uncharacterized protein n=1 Tax=Crucibulum laeve TaxID=68775 RepID=A0A5C3MFT4_9AGAR|nr:hypothetical protein BDQ12DRAFT_718721 [Crucibulum laeve]
MSDGYSPPPAYSEQDFDQKVATATELSLLVSQPQGRTDIAEEEWEQWDEAIADAAAHHQGSASAGTPHGFRTNHTVGDYSTRQQMHKISPSVQPLYIHKKSKSEEASETAKAHPSWSLQSGSSYDNSLANHSMRQSPLSADRLHFDDRSLVPPPFATMGSSLDDMKPNACENMHQQQPAPHRYTATGLHSVEGKNMSTHTARQGHRRYGSTQILQDNTGRYLPHNHNAPSRRALPSVPRVKFDPSMAYSTTGTSAQSDMSAAQPIQSYNAAAFYNSSVSPHLAVSSPSTQTYSPRDSRGGFQSQINTGSHRESNWGAGSPSSWSPPQSPLPGYHPSPTNNATHFPQYPSYSSVATNSNDRWATSEHDFTGHFH